MSVNTTGIKFLHRWVLGAFDFDNPGNNVISVTSTAAGDFAPKNLTTDILREVWRSATASTTQEIIMEVNDPDTIIDTFAILNHNLTSIAVVQVQAANDVGFLIPAFTLSMTYNKQNMVLLQDLGASYTYFKIKITDPTNPCGYIEIGRVVAGRSFTFTNNEDITDRINVKRDDLAYKMKSEGFFRASNEKVKVDKLRVDFKNLKSLAADDNTNYLGLKDLFENVGETYPFLTIADPSDPYFICMWGLVDDIPAFGYDINRYVDVSLTIQEVF